MKLIARLHASPATGPIPSVDGFRPLSAMDNCLWCGELFAAKTAGPHRKKFCSARCKDRYHAGLRRWTQRHIDMGKVSIEELHATNVSCTTNAGVLDSIEAFAGIQEPRKRSSESTPPLLGARLVGAMP